MYRWYDPCRSAAANSALDPVPELATTQRVRAGTAA
jgi:hypothetical protein